MCTVTEALTYIPHMPTWCGKCLRNNPGHEEVDCPTCELCRNCGRHGNLYFLHTHKCNDTNDQLMHREDNEVPDLELYSDGKS